MPAPACVATIKSARLGQLVTKSCPEVHITAEQQQSSSRAGARCCAWCQHWTVWQPSNRPSDWLQPCGLTACPCAPQFARLESLLQQAVRSPARQEWVTQGGDRIRSETGEQLLRGARWSALSAPTLAGCLSWCGQVLRRADAVCLCAVDCHSTCLSVSDTVVVPAYCMCCRQQAATGSRTSCAKLSACCRQHMVCCRPQGLPAGGTNIQGTTAARPLHAGAIALPLLLLSDAAAGTQVACCWPFDLHA